MAVSADGGASFGEALVLDRDAPFGRTDVILDGNGAAWVVWLARSGEEAEVRLRRFPAEGPPDEPLAVARTAGSRTSGFPILARVGARIFVAWTEVEGEVPSRVRVAEVLTGGPESG